MNYETQYPDASIQFNPFAFANTGIVKAQSLLKIDTYTLITVPFQFSMKRGILIASLSRDETAFFARYVGAAASLNLHVQRADQKEPIKIFARCHVSKVGQMKDREGLALIVLEWKPLPPDLAEVLGRYLDLVERLKVEAGDFRDKAIVIDAANAKRLGYNNYAVLRKGQEQYKVALFSLAANRADFLIPLREPDRTPGEDVSLDLFFLKYRFNVAAKIASSQRLPTGVQRCRVELGFSAELVHILEEWFWGRRQ
ncbi:MAG TPA: PilZN3 domain-containing protein [Rectinemataceae bacterium]|nr:PilZN3 domain-containing protein [Rectinemataceae bacterium]